MIKVEVAMRANYPLNRLKCAASPVAASALCVAVVALVALGAAGCKAPGSNVTPKTTVDAAPAPPALRAEPAMHPEWKNAAAFKALAVGSRV
ncbi:hypothetical protein B2G74_16060 [Burkholderia sp. A27]|jgi:hypothetical protein|nr:hypothetical protein B2G74_16060 [Burkholderia sp. A27]